MAAVGEQQQILLHLVSVRTTARAELLLFFLLIAGCLFPCFTAAAICQQQTVYGCPSWQLVASAAALPLSLPLCIAGLSSLQVAVWL